MKFEKYYIVGNVREEFDNMSKYCNRIYNDHPSMESVRYTVNQLRDKGYNIEYFGGINELITAYQEKQTYENTLFLNFSDGLSQSNRKAQSAILLELLNVPFAGSDALSRLIAGNKMYSKSCLPSNILSPKGILVFSEKDIPEDLIFPIIAKPNREGSSLGITQKSLCNSYAELYEYLLENLPLYKEILVEEYKEGYEITCFVIGNKSNYYLVEPIICAYDNIIYFESFVFGIEEKSNRKRKEYLASNYLDEAKVEKIKSSAITIFEALGMRDFARIDFRLNNNNELYFLETNGNPVISKTSEIGVISANKGIPYSDIISYIIETATNRINHE